MKRALVALPAMLALAACSSEPEPVETPSPTPTQAGPRTLVAAGLSEQDLGPIIMGPDGAEVESTVTFEGREIATVVSYVACPSYDEGDVELEAREGENVLPMCGPTIQTDDAVYTYVHRVTPGEGADGPLFSFRTSRRATGFANVIGFDRAQAEAALGEGYAIGVSIDNGQLIWRIETGDGWDAGEEITFFWQTTLAPEGPMEAFLIENGTGQAGATGPFPPAEEPEEETAE